MALNRNIKYSCGVFLLLFTATFFFCSYIHYTYYVFDIKEIFLEIICKKKNLISTGRIWTFILRLQLIFPSKVGSWHRWCACLAGKKSLSLKLIGGDENILKFFSIFFLFSSKLRHEILSETDLVKHPLKPKNYIRYDSWLLSNWSVCRLDFTIELILASNQVIASDYFTWNRMYVCLYYTCWKHFKSFQVYSVWKETNFYPQVNPVHLPSLRNFVLIYRMRALFQDEINWFMHARIKSFVIVATFTIR